MTNRQGEVLAAIGAFIARHGYSPTIRELAAVLGVTSTHGVAQMVDALVREGRVLRAPGKSRTMRPVAQVSVSASQWAAITHLVETIGELRHNGPDTSAAQYDCDDCGYVGPGAPTHGIEALGEIERREEIYQEMGATSTDAARQVADDWTDEHPPTCPACSISLETGDARVAAVLMAATELGSSLDLARYAHTQWAALAAGPQWFAAQGGGK